MRDSIYRLEQDLQRLRDPLQVRQGLPLSLDCVSLVPVVGFLPPLPWLLARLLDPCEGPSLGHVMALEADNPLVDRKTTKAGRPLATRERSYR